MELSQLINQNLLLSEVPNLTAEAVQSIRVEISIVLLRGVTDVTSFGLFVNTMQDRLS
jgi:hypothetical protein